MPRFRWMAHALVLAGAALLAAAAPAAMAAEATAGAASVDPRLWRATAQGLVRGAAEARTGTFRWLGLPYAKPPTGALRWKPPVDPDAWAGARDATAFGPSCAQSGRFFSPAPDNAPFGLSVRDGFGQLVGSEDCLTLNVWRPADNAGPLPVIVFIHGGSNISGYSSDPIYQGGPLAAKARAVVVTINYRLGLFGWLDMGQLKTGEPRNDSGNFGNLDHLQALKYIRTNIAAFGGDPGNVTVMGESAGSVNTWALLVSPLARGLFHKAVSMSGGMQTTDGLTAKLYAGALMHKLLIADGRAWDDVSAELYLLTQTRQQVADFLRSRTAQQLVQAERAVGVPAPAVFADGTVLPSSPIAAIWTGQYNRVPMLAGNTRDEGKLFGPFKASEYDRFTMQYQFDPDAPPTLTEADFLNPLFLPVDRPVTGWNTISSVATTAVFGKGTIESMNALSFQQPWQTWYYRFDWDEEPAPFDTVYGAAHAMDLPFVFGNFGRSALSFAFSEANKPGRLALSDAMMRSIGAFAWTGNPQNASLGSYWPTWPGRMVFDASKTQGAMRAEW
ncbi:carboxylesterase family protein [Mitsuaria sp. GD03876]|uniref:carboxylesterase/lipase family protein n=1 Tax=Mitsuaria sp. GD03876 TaxID=2975399 RepID=UPI00244B3B26|nr:carboxylesterase family protein [Mitsuaria sp. GD03876]MDH0866495.1 carboxylesterase family protein [Mitsuaria sp. GD03876]